MNIVFGRGITFGQGITFGPYQAPPTPITANLVVSYDAGNSVSYSGSGILFNSEYTGPNLGVPPSPPDYEQYGVFDLAYLTGGPGNSGFLYTSGDVIGWTNNGTASYFTLDNTDSSTSGPGGNQQYIDSSFQQDGPVLTSPTYTIMAVVRPQNFAQGAIVGGNETVFAFVPVGGPDDGPSLVAGNSYSGPDVADTTTSYQTDTWYCVAVTYDTTSSTMKLYSNGNLVATNTEVGPTTGPSGLYWGTLEGVLWFTGDMAICQYWNDRVLTASEISTLSTQYLSRYNPPAATSSVVLTRTGDFYTWTVPEGVTSISVVAVGGGGGGTNVEYSIPGADTYMYVNSEVALAGFTSSVDNQIIFDNTAYPDILNVTANGSWCVIGNPIGPNSAVDLVTDVQTDGANTTITIDQSISYSVGDEFTFVECIVAAEGGYEIPSYYYDQAGEDPSNVNPEGNGARALPLVTDGPYGLGGVVDWTATYPIGGGGAGGYGIPGLALNPGRSGSWIYDNLGDTGYHTMSFSSNYLTVTALSGMGTGGANQECMTVGTQRIVPGSKIMYSLTIDQLSTSNGYCGVGIANYGDNVQQYLGYSTYSIGWFDDGGVYIDGNRLTTIAPFVAGNVVDIAIDADLQLVWFRADGGAWNNSAADPTTGTGGIDISSVFGTNSAQSVGISPWYNSDDDTYDVVSIATTAFFTGPAGFTFVPGVPNAGGQGGDGAGFYDATNFAGTGGAGGGGGGRIFDSGSGGGGTGLYGIGANGASGDCESTENTDTIFAGAVGGSNNFILNGNGGQATPWNGGRGGYPGGAGASAPGYWVAGNGGALAYRNNYEVTPGDTYTFQIGQGGAGVGAGGSGADGAIRIVWPGNYRQFPDNAVAPDTYSVPTIDITDSTFGGQSGTVTYNITSNGGAVILESGIVWGVLSDHQYSGSVDICDGGSFTEQRSALRDNDGSCGNPITTGQSGSFTQDAQVYNFGGEEIYVYAYARNYAGVAYSPTYLTWNVVPCLAEGTLITLADGTTKAIEDLAMSDTLKVWDFDNSESTTAPVLWLQRKQSTIQYNFCKFSDGTELKTIGQHRIFNKQAGKFTYPMMDETPIGTITVKSDGTEVTLTDKSVVYAEVNYYNLITEHHINCYANGILTSNRFSNVYPITDMRYVKDGRALRNRSEFVGIADRWIDGLRLTEQTIELKALQKRVTAYENAEKVAVVAPARPSWHRE